MKKLLLCLSALCITFATYASKIDTIQVYSQAMQKNIKNVIITPDSYSSSKTYAVVYMLHGASGNHQAWLKKSPAIETYADQYNVIIVCPDGDKTSWYFDSPVDDKMKYETYVSQELVSKIDATYSTIKSPKGRAISGYSMGGHGALYLAFKHQDVWGVTASMSGGVDLRPFPRGWDLPKRLGTYAEHPENWEQNSVINLTHLLNGKGLKILFDCGVDDFFYDANVRLHDKLVERNIPHDFISRPGGHTNAYWDNSAKYHLLFFNEFFKANSKTD